MKHKKEEYRVGIGSSLVLMILVVLAMTALGLLALGSARQTEAQTARNLEASLSYYEAAARVQSALADIDGIIVEHELSASDAPLDESLFAGIAAEGVEWSRQGDALGFTINEDAGAGRTLVVKGDIPGEGGERFRLYSHTLIAAINDDDDDFLLIGE